VEFRRAIRSAGLPPRLFTCLFRQDGRAFSRWEFRGVPPEFAERVAETTEVIWRMVKAGWLPKDLNELTYLGLEALSERFVNEGEGGDGVPGAGAPDTGE
jgi:hypothetical protein